MSQRSGVLHELKHHAPFTLMGALLGIVFMMLFRGLGQTGGHYLFMIFHPAHVLLSAMVTAAIFKIHRGKSSFLLVLLIGYVGSVGIATLSDSIIPFIGEKVLGLDIPAHSEVFHEAPGDGEHGKHAHHDHAGDAHEQGGIHVHLGFIEEWYIVNPAALVGIVLAWFLRSTRLSHMAHVLISTWASSAHVLMNTSGDYTVGVWAGLLAMLFLAVWLPCCVSDIVFPMLFVGSGHQRASGSCCCSGECHDQSK